MWPRSKKPAPPTVQHRLGHEAGRPIRPPLSGTDDLEETPHDQRLLALSWAAEWLACNIDIGKANTYLAPLLRWDFSGQDETPEAEVAEVARHALWIAIDERKTQRTSRALPWLVFSPPEGCCSAAIALDGHLLAAAERPRLPLRTCDARICKCKFRQISRMEYERLSAEITGAPLDR